jgi:hypothetical protein
MSVTFTRATQTYTPTTDVTAVTETTITGSAVQVRGNAQRYADQGLTLSTMPTLLISAEDYGLVSFSEDFVRPGDTVEWPTGSGTIYTVKDVEPVAPDGYAIIARVAIAR